MTRLSELQCGAIDEARRSLEDAGMSAVEAPRRARDCTRRANWLRERFPDARLPDVEGLMKLFERRAVKSHDWSLVPGRYVGVAPEESDGDPDFEEVLRPIQIGPKGLNEKATALAARIVRNLQVLRA